MEKAVYPAKLCREGMFNAHGIGYTCELPLLHPGPHATFSVSTTVEQRNNWESANPDWKSRIGSLDDEV